MSGYPYPSGDYYYRALYPRRDGNRSYRNPYEERVLGDLARANDPYAARDQGRVTTIRDQDRDRGRSSDRRPYQPSPPPLVTVTAPREEQRRSVPPMDRSGPYGSFARYSATPPPRGSRWTVGNFEETFGNVPESRGRTTDRLRYSPPGPPPNPFTRYSSVGDRPYGGRPPPRNPYTPDGQIYDYPGSDRRRRQSVGPDPARSEFRHGREHDHHRSRIGGSWGLAEYQDYQERLSRRYSPSPRPGPY